MSSYNASIYIPTIQKETEVHRGSIKIRSKAYWIIPHLDFPESCTISIALQTFVYYDKTCIDSASCA